MCSFLLLSLCSTCSATAGEWSGGSAAAAGIGGESRQEAEASRKVSTERIHARTCKTCRAFIFILRDLAREDFSARVRRQCSPPPPRRLHPRPHSLAFVSNLTFSMERAALHASTSGRGQSVCCSASGVRPTPRSAARNQHRATPRAVQQLVQPHLVSSLASSSNGLNSLHNGHGVKQASKLKVAVDVDEGRLPHDASQPPPVRSSKEGRQHTTLRPRSVLGRFLHSLNKFLEDTYDLKHDVSNKFVGVVCAAARQIRLPTHPLSPPRELTAPLPRPRPGRSGGRLLGLRVCPHLGLQP